MKLTPNVADPGGGRGRGRGGGADAVSLINTLKARAIDPATGEPGIAAGHGGLSGPAVRPVALQQVRAVPPPSSLPLIGMGGISSGADALEFLAVGAAWWRSGPRVSATQGPARRVAEELAETARDATSGHGRTRPRVEVEVNLAAIGPIRLARPRAAAILAAHMPAPQ